MWRILLLLFVLVCHSAPIISNSTVDSVTAHGARFSWTTDVASTTSKIKVGLADPPTTVITPIADGSYTTHVFFASGLTAGTTYYWQVCSTNAGETCTASATFPTLAAASGTSTLPTAPTAVTTAMPTITGSTLNVAANCSDFQAQIDAAALLDGALTHAVVIPAGSECVGRHIMRAKTGANPTGAGFIVIMSGGTLPPNDNRTSPTMAAGAATILANYLHAYYQISAPGTCNAGDLWLDTDAGSNAINYCTAANTWTPQTVSTGAGAPVSTCTVNAWYRNTSEADPHKAFWWCTTTNKNRNVYIDSSSNYTNWAGLYSPGSVKGYRVVGLKLQDIERPAAYTNLLSTTTGSGDEIGSKSFCLAYTNSTDSYIIFDRVLFEGQGQPHRQQEALCFFDGSNIAVIGSYFNEINTWRPTSAGETATHGIFFLNGVGPVSIYNNYFGNISGMSIFNSDDNPIGQVNDVTIERNEFFVSPTLNISEATSNGKLYYFRHHIEMKRGVRWSIKGNKMTGGFPSGNPNAATIGLTPTNGVSTALQCRTNTIQIADINIESNKILYVPQVLLMVGHNVYGAGQCDTYGTIRIAFKNNVIYTTGQSSTGETDGAYGGYTFSGAMSDSGFGWEDLTFTNNLLFRPTSAVSAANSLGFSGGWRDWKNSRLTFANNLYFTAVGEVMRRWGINWTGTAAYGTDALNDLIEPDSTYFVKGNGYQEGWTGVFEYNDPYPAGNYRSYTGTDFTSSFYRCSVCGDEAAFRPLYNSKFAAGSAVARGYNGTDAGPDFVSFDAAQGLTRNQRALSIASITATVAYTAPDANSCVVEYGTSATALTGARVTDGGGSRFRTVNLTGLTASTSYHYRIFCGVMVNGTFTTTP